MCQTFDESFRHWAPHESLSTATTQCVPRPASSPCAKCDRGQWLTSHFRLGLFTTQFDQKLSLHFLQCQVTAMDTENRITAPDSWGFQNLWDFFGLAGVLNSWTLQNQHTSNLFFFRSFCSNYLLCALRHFQNCYLVFVDKSKYNPGGYKLGEQLIICNNLHESVWTRFKIPTIPWLPIHDTFA